MTKLFTRLFIAVAAVAMIMSTSNVQADHHKKSKDGYAKSTKTIVEVAAGNEDFSTLVAAVKAAGLVETLSSEGPFTVFAPTNDAFDKLPAGTVQTLLKPENKDQLTAILTYHVASGKVKAKDVVGLDEVETVNGASAKVTVTNNTVSINQAKVVTTDIMASNGVIHVIDEVILPPTNESAAAELIRGAINRGAPLYNAGMPEACVAVYEVAAMALMEMDGVNRGAKMAIESAMKSAHSKSSASDRAWALRSGLDKALSMM